MRHPRRSLLLLACAVALAVGAGPAFAAAPTPSQGTPTELWEQYPLEPGPGERSETQVQQLPDIQPAAASSGNSMLLIGGLALVILVLADMAFLTLSVRLLRRAS